MYLFYEATEKSLTIFKTGKCYGAYLWSHHMDVRQKNLEFETSLGYLVRPCSRGGKKKKIQETKSVKNYYGPYKMIILLKNFRKKLGLVVQSCNSSY